MDEEEAISDSQFIITHQVTVLRGLDEQGSPTDRVIFQEGSVDPVAIIGMLECAKLAIFLGRVGTWDSRDHDEDDDEL